MVTRLVVTMVTRLGRESIVIIIIIIIIIKLDMDKLKMRCCYHAY